MELGMVSWHGTNMLQYIFGRIGTSFGVSFLQTEASLKKARGSEREHVTFECETIYVVPLSLFTKAHTLTTNKVILEQVMSHYNRKHKYYWNRGRSIYYHLCAATRPLFLFARRCRAG